MPWLRQRWRGRWWRQQQHNGVDGKSPLNQTMMVGKRRRRQAVLAKGSRGLRGLINSSGPASLACEAIAPPLLPSRFCVVQNQLKVLWFHLLGRVAKHATT